MQAILGERAGPQDALRAESVALGEEIREFQDRVRPLSDRVQNPAQEAVNHLSAHAPRVMEHASALLSEGRPHVARGEQRQAGELLERAAQLADDMAAALRSEMPEGHAGEHGAEEGDGHAGEAPGMLGTRCGGRRRSYSRREGARSASG